MFLRFRWDCCGCCTALLGRRCRIHGLGVLAPPAVLKIITRHRRQVMKHCSEDGVVSPKTCVYLAEWLKLPNSDELF